MYVDKTKMLIFTFCSIVFKSEQLLSTCQSLLRKEGKTETWQSWLRSGHSWSSRVTLHDSETAWTNHSVTQHKWTDDKGGELKRREEKKVVTCTVRGAKRRGREDEEYREGKEEMRRRSREEMKKNSLVMRRWVSEDHKWHEELVRRHEQGGGEEEFLPWQWRTCWEVTGEDRSESWRSSNEFINPPPPPSLLLLLSPSLHPKHGPGLLPFSSPCSSLLFSLVFSPYRADPWVSSKSDSIVCCIPQRVIVKLSQLAASSRTSSQFLHVCGVCAKLC